MSQQYVIRICVFRSIIIFDRTHFQPCLRFLSDEPFQLESTSTCSGPRSSSVEWDDALEPKPLSPSWCGVLLFHGCHRRLWMTIARRNQQRGAEGWESRGFDWWVQPPRTLNSKLLPYPANILSWLRYFRAPLFYRGSLTPVPPFLEQDSYSRTPNTHCLSPQITLMLASHSQFLLAYSPNVL